MLLLTVNSSELLEAVILALALQMKLQSILCSTA